MPGVVKISKRSNITDLSDDSVSFVSAFLEMDINPYEKIFDQLPDLFTQDKSLALTVDRVRQIRQELDSALIKYEKCIALKLVEEVKPTAENLIMLIAELPELSSNNSTDPLIDIFFRNKEKTLSLQDYEVIEAISLAIFKQPVEDWNYDKSTDLIESVKKFLSKETTAKDEKFNETIASFDDFSDIEEDPLEINLLNILKGDLDSFGDARYLF